VIYWRVLLIQYRFKWLIERETNTSNANKKLWREHRARYELETFDSIEWLLIDTNVNVSTKTCENSPRRSGLDRICSRTNSRRGTRHNFCAPRPLKIFQNLNVINSRRLIRSNDFISKKTLKRMKHSKKCLSPTEEKVRKIQSFDELYGQTSWQMSAQSPHKQLGSPWLLSRRSKFGCTNRSRAALAEAPPQSLFGQRIHN
jgi:hypothetical protein